MVDDKRKKNNNKKKNKNKQSNKVVEEPVALLANANGEGQEATASASASVESQNQLTNGKNHQNGTVEAAVEEADAANEHQPKGAEAIEAGLAQAEKQQWLQTEASLHETILKLRNENDMHLQKQVDLEIKLAQLQNEKESWLEREVRFEEKIGLLSEDKASLVFKQENLEEKIRQLEKDCDSSIVKEKSNNETISNMEMELTNLRLQVAELEESKNISGQEIQQLKEAISTFQAEIQNLESCNISTSHVLDEQMKTSEYDTLNSELEGAYALVERLINENSELVEKVNELYLKIDHVKPTSANFSSVAGANGTISVADRSSISRKTLPSLPEDPEAPSEIIIVQDEPRQSDTTNHSMVMSNSLRSEDSGEIVQIPLDQNEVQMVESLGGGADDNGATYIPITDAPLIGAPFRFISFVAGYVSGADLIDKESRK